MVCKVYNAYSISIWPCNLLIFDTTTGVEYEKIIVPTICGTGACECSEPSVGSRDGAPTQTV